MKINFSKLILLSVIFFFSKNYCMTSKVESINDKIDRATDAYYECMRKETQPKRDQIGDLVFNPCNEEAKKKCAVVFQKILHEKSNINLKNK